MRHAEHTLQPADLFCSGKRLRGVPLRFGARCRCAAYCCPKQQRAAWLRHKAVCTVRAAVEEARRKLMGRADAPAHTACTDSGP